MDNTEADRRGRAPGKLDWWTLELEIHILFFSLHTQSLNSAVYLILMAHLDSDLAEFKRLVATCGQAPCSVGRERPTLAAGLAVTVSVGPHSSCQMKNGPCPPPTGKVGVPMRPSL